MLLFRQNLRERVSDWFIQHASGGGRNRVGLLFALWPRLFHLHWCITERLSHLLPRIPAPPSALCYSLSHRVQVDHWMENIYFLLLRDLLNFLHTLYPLEPTHKKKNTATVFHLCGVSSAVEQLPLQSCNCWWFIMISIFTNYYFLKFSCGLGFFFFVNSSWLLSTVRFIV